MAKLNDLEWRILVALKREFEPEEIVPDIWRARATEAGVPLETFYEVAEDLDRRKIIGRFSTFLEHVKPLQDGERVTRFNALFHWAVPPGREIEAGQGSGPPSHHDSRLLARRRSGVSQRERHGRGARNGQAVVLAHKAAIDEHLKSCGIPVSLHQRLLGRPQRDQALGNFAVRLSRVVHFRWPQSRSNARRIAAYGVPPLGGLMFGASLGFGFWSFRCIPPRFLPPRSQRRGHRDFLR